MKSIEFRWNPWTRLCRRNRYISNVSSGLLHITTQYLPSCSQTLQFASAQASGRTMRSVRMKIETTTFIQQQTINYVFSFISTFLFWCNWESARAASSVTCRNCIYFNQTIPYNTQMRCEIANSLCCQTRQPRYSFTHESASFQKMYTRIFMIDEKLFPIRGQ